MTSTPEQDEAYFAEEARRALEPTLSEFENLADRHGPPGWRDRIPPNMLHEVVLSGYPWPAFVIAADLRRSTFLMKEAVSATTHARVMSMWIGISRYIVNQLGGWFDAFTGDGFLAYWLWPPGEGLSRADPELNGVVTAIVRLHLGFPNLLTAFRQNSRNFPSEAGLAIGVDVGEVNPTIINRELAIVGSPVVGAVRMVSAAEAGGTMCNVGFGQLILGAKQGPAGAEMVPRQVATKEYPDGQDAFEFVFDAALMAEGAPAEPGGSPS